MSPPDGAAEIRSIVENAEEVKIEPPRPLMRELPPADPFPADALGDVLGAAARAIRDRVQAPLAICAQSIISAATLAVQAHADVVLPIGQARPLSDTSFPSRKPASARAHATPTLPGQSAGARRHCQLAPKRDPGLARDPNPVERLWSGRPRSPRRGPACVAQCPHKRRSDARGEAAVGPGGDPRATGLSFGF